MMPGAVSLATPLARKIDALARQRATKPPASPVCGRDELQEAWERRARQADADRVVLDQAIAEGIAEAARQHVVEIGPITARRIMDTVCRRLGISRTQMLSHRRTRADVRPRQIVMYLARELTRLSLPQIGNHLGGRDHTTILHGWRTIAALMQADPEIAATVAELRAELEARP